MKKQGQINFNDLIKLTKDFSKNNFSRICLHESSEDILQLMAIAVAKNITYPRHFHPKKDEYYFLLKGSLIVKCFYPSGKIKSSVKLCETGELSCFVARNTIHSVSSLEEGALFLEFANGPFNENSTIKI